MDPEHASPERARTLADLAADEGGSAAIEFIVLIPVYVTLLTMLFSLGQMSLARQALAMASRHDAWTAGRIDDEHLKDAFFGPYAGTYTSTVAKTPLDEDPSYRDLRRDLRDAGGSGAALKIAQHVLQNSVYERGAGTAPFRRYTGAARFRYEGLILGTRSVEMSANPQVVLPNLARDFERPVHESGEQGHFVAEGKLGPGNNVAPFDPAEADHRYLAPVFGTFRDGRSREPGIWSVDARIEGSASGEHGFFRGKIQEAGVVVGR